MRLLNIVSLPLKTYPPILRAAAGFKGSRMAFHHDGNEAQSMPTADAKSSCFQSLNLATLPIPAESKRALTSSIDSKEVSKANLRVRGRFRQVC